MTTAHEWKEPAKLAGSFCVSCGGILALRTLDSCMSYALPADLLARYDARIIGDLVSDDNTQVSPGNLLTNTNVAVALNDAASMVDANCQIGQRYTQAELAALAGTDQNLLFRLCCDLAFTYLCQRRGMKPPTYDEAYKRSDDFLMRIRNGEAIFNVLADVGASLPTDEFPSQATYQTVNDIRTATQNHLYPVRRVQQPASGGYSGSY